jgi:hypothetical protein
MNYDEQIQTILNSANKEIKDFLAVILSTFNQVSLVQVVFT